jgi:hypothetical protein
MEDGIQTSSLKKESIFSITPIPSDINDADEVGGQEVIGTRYRAFNIKSNRINKFSI